MKKLIIPISVGWLCLSFINPQTLVKGPGKEKFSPATDIHILYSNGTGTALYQHSKLEQYGLSTDAFEYAWKGYQSLRSSGKLSNTHYLTICDFSQSSRRKRLYIIDVDNEKLLINTWVAHGQKSGNEYATQFSNKPESLQSSLGFFITSSTYNGKNGFSLKLNGLEPGFNSNAMERTIVIHGATYVDGARLRAGYYMGRSWGCPAVPKNESAKIINIIKNGTCLFVYHHSDDYLTHSKLLND